MGKVVNKNILSTKMYGIASVYGKLHVLCVWKTAPVGTTNRTRPHAGGPNASSIGELSVYTGFNTGFLLEGGGDWYLGGISQGYPPKRV